MPYFFNSLLGAYDGAKGRGASGALTSETYKLPEIISAECVTDSWTPMTIVNAPLARRGHTALWTGSEMIVWGGTDQDFAQTNTGGRYDPTTDSWTATSIINAPDARWLDSAVWTGSEMIVWGGGSNMDLNSGGRYNPITDTWTATSIVNAPIPRAYHTAVWTGNEMIIWGGSGCGGNCILNTGGRYNPTNDSWMPTASTSVTARFLHTALWTGSEMIVWGGSDSMHYLHTGGRYNPTTDVWTPTGLTNVPLGRVSHSAVWDGNEMIIWGGVDESFNVTNTGCRYTVVDDNWEATSFANAPSSRSGATGVWTGSEMIVWGGGNTGGNFNTGGRYNASTDSWTPTTTANAPLARDSFTAVWTGSGMIIWGGSSSGGVVLNTGASYCAQSGATPTPTATATATSTGTPTASATPTLTPTATPAAGAPAKALNISTRLRVEAGDNVLIGGLIVTGSAPKNVVVRGIGPSLAGSGVNDPLADPVLELRDGSGALLFQNDNWQDDSGQASQLIALDLSPSHPSESGIVASLEPGASYTAILAGKDSGVGVGLVEVYDVSQASNSQLANISSRGLVQTGDNVMIGGFILGGGSANTSVAVRGIGPSLTQIGLTNVLADPTLELRDSNGALLVSNDNWQDDAASAAQLSSHGLAPQNSLEAGIFTSLTPGAFTAILAGKDSGIGIGLVEIYNLQQN